MRIESGIDYPLGAVFDGEGTNFALFSEYPLTPKTAESRTSSVGESGSGALLIM